MFNETHIDTLPTSKQVALTFIKSTNVQVFPCGRRRSSFINTDLNGDNKVGSTEGYRIPFDPEARLNTEANNRKHSGLNGYTQTYLNNWDAGSLSLSLAGYLFNIKLESDYTDKSDFGNKVFNVLKTASSFDTDFGAHSDCIYANILIKDAKLFAGFQDYLSEVLCNQSEELNEPVLDLPISSLNPKNINEDYFKIDNYYFSGLSFSTTPLTDSMDSFISDGAGIIATRINPSGIKQTVVSLPILDKVGSEWKVHQPAYLPNIKHGSTEGSAVIRELQTASIEAENVKVANEFNVNASGDINLIGSINAEKLMQNNKQVPVIDIAPSSDSAGNACWQLQISIN